MTRSPDSPSAGVSHPSHLRAHISHVLKVCSTPKNLFFADVTKQIGIILIHSYRAVIVVLVVAIFLFDNLRERGQFL